MNDQELDWYLLGIEDAEIEDGRITESDWNEEEQNEK